jgi:hypothetical protein
LLSSTADFGKIIVHGHTPTERPEILPNRINIDTGAFATGRLICVVLGGSEPWPPPRIIFRPGNERDFPLTVFPGGSSGNPPDSWNN